MSRYEGGERSTSHRGRGGGGGRDRGGGGPRSGPPRGSEAHSQQPAASSQAPPAPAAHSAKDTGGHHHTQQRSGAGGGGGAGYDRDWYYGLYTFTNGNSFHPLPAKAVSVHASLSALSVEVTVIQRYINHEKQPIDATFIFPVPFQAAVREFEATFDDHVIVGQVREKSRSHNTEPDTGNTTVYLLEQQERMQLKAIVPNWASGKELKFKVTYLADVPVTPDWSATSADPQHRLKLVLPAKLIPSIKKREGEKRDPFKVELHVDFDLPAGVSELETNVASAIQLKDLQRGSIALASRVFSLPHDFIAYLKLNNYVDRTFVEVDSKGSHVIAVEFYPPLPKASRGGADRGDKSTEKDSGSDDEAESGEKSADGPAAASSSSSQSHKRGKWERSPVLADLTLTTEPSVLRSAVVGVPSVLYDNTRVLCYCLLPAEHPVDTPVKLTFSGKAKSGTAAKDFSVTVTALPSSAVSGARLHALYGKQLIRELEQSGPNARHQQQTSQSSSATSESGSAPAPAAPPAGREEIAKSVVSAAQKFGVWLPGPAVPFVSFWKKSAQDGQVTLKEVAMPPRKQRPPRVEDTHQRPERAERPDRGHSDRSQQQQGSSAPAAAQGPPPGRRPDDHPAVPQQGRGFSSDRGGRGGGRGGAAAPAVSHQQHQQNQQQGQRRDRDDRRGGPSSSSSAAAAPAAAANAADSQGHAYEPDTLFSEIARLQTSSGFWTLTRKLAEILCIEFPDLLAAIKDTHDQDRQWATSLTITFLESGLGGDAAKTGRVVALGRAWLHHHVGVEKATEWLDKAKKFISDHIEIIVE